MKKYKVVTIIGTRPEIIKLSLIIQKADLFFDHVIVHTGQNYAYTLNEVFFNEMGIRRPDFFLDVVDSNLGGTIGNIISRSFQLLSELQPDAVIILGDTNSALSAISAKRLKIPIFHLEAGNRCFDENLPEEINRKIVDHISDINLAYSEHARRNLFSEGIKKDFIFVVGSPMYEVLNSFKLKIRSSKILDTLNLSINGYIVLSAHREENIDISKNFFELMNSINSMAKHFNIPIIYSLHPRSRKVINERNFVFHPLVNLIEPLGFFDYVNLQMNSKCVISDSGTLAEEASILGFAAVSIRTSTERPEALDRGGFIIGSLNERALVLGAEMAIQQKANLSVIDLVSEYTINNTSSTVVNIVQSYVDIVNRKTWNKQ